MGSRRFLVVKYSVYSGCTKNKATVFKTVAWSFAVLRPVAAMQARGELTAFTAALAGVLFATGGFAAL
jgi:hypothetical protein